MNSLDLSNDGEIIKEEPDIITPSVHEFTERLLDACRDNNNTTNIIKVCSELYSDIIDGLRVEFDNALSMAVSAIKLEIMAELSMTGRMKDTPINITNDTSDIIGCINEMTSDNKMTSDDCPYDRSFYIPPIDHDELDSIIDGYDAIKETQEFIPASLENNSLFKLACKRVEEFMEGK